MAKPTDTIEETPAEVTPTPTPTTMVGPEKLKEIIEPEEFEFQDLKLKNLGHMMRTEANPRGQESVLDFHAKKLGLPREKLDQALQSQGFNVESFKQKVGVEGADVDEYLKGLELSGVSAASMTPQQRRIELKGQRTLAVGRARQKLRIGRTVEAGEDFSERLATGGPDRIVFSDYEKSGFFGTNVEDAPEITQRGETAFQGAEQFNQFLEASDDPKIKKMIKMRDTYQDIEMGASHYITERALDILNARGIEENATPVDQWESEYAQAAQRAAKEIATWKTIGIWQSPTFIRWSDLKPGQEMTWGEAFKPTLEVVGLNAKGQPVARTQGSLQWGLELSDILQSAATGIITEDDASLGQRALSGVSKRRNLLEASLESDLAQGSTAGKVLAGGGGFLASILFPDLTFGLAGVGKSVSKHVARRGLIKSARRVAAHQETAAKTMVEALQSGDREALKRSATDSAAARELSPLSMDRVDTNDFNVARRLAKDNPDILGKSGNELADQLPGEAGELSVNLHPSQRKRYAKKGGPGAPKLDEFSEVPKIGYEELYDYGHHLDLIDEGKRLVDAKDFAVYAKWVKKAATKGATRVLGAVKKLKGADGYDEIESALRDFSLMARDSGGWVADTGALIEHVGLSAGLSATEVRALVEGVTKQLSGIAGDVDKAVKGAGSFEDIGKALARGEEAVKTNIEARAVALAFERELLLGGLGLKPEPIIARTINKVRELRELSDEAVSFMDDAVDTFGLTKDQAIEAARLMDLAATKYARETNLDAARWWQKHYAGMADKAAFMSKLGIRRGTWSQTIKHVAAQAETALPEGYRLIGVGDEVIEAVGDLDSTRKRFVQALDEFEDEISDDALDLLTLLSDLGEPGGGSRTFSIEDGVAVFSQKAFDAIINSEMFKAEPKLVKLLDDMIEDKMFVKAPPKWQVIDKTGQIISEAADDVLDVVEVAVKKLIDEGAIVRSAEDIEIGHPIRVGPIIYGMSIDAVDAAISGGYKFEWGGTWIDGKMAFRKKGTTRKVPWSQAERDVISRSENVSFTHNHPNFSWFSTGSGDMAFAAVYDVRDFRVVWPDGTMIKVEVPGGWGSIALEANSAKGLPTDHGKLLQWRGGLGSYVAGPSRKVANRAATQARAAGRQFTPRDYAVAYTTEANRRLHELGRKVGVDLRISVRQPNEGIELGLRGARLAPGPLAAEVAREAADKQNLEVLLQAVDGKSDIFYSRLGQLAKGMPKKMGINDVVSFLAGKGAKKEEIEWTNIAEFLEDAAAQGKKSVTRDEVLKHLEDNRVVVDEALSGVMPPKVRLAQTATTEALEATHAATDGMSGLTPGRKHQFTTDPMHAMTNIATQVDHRVRKTIRALVMYQRDLQGFSTASQVVTERLQQIRALTPPGWAEKVPRTSETGDWISSLSSVQLGELGRVLSRSSRLQNLTTLTQQILPDLQDYTAMRRVLETPEGEKWVDLHKKLEEAKRLADVNPPRYEGATLPGGTDYREVKITLPLTPKARKILADPDVQELLTKHGEAVEVEWDDMVGVAIFDRVRQRYGIPEGTSIGDWLKAVRKKFTHGHWPNEPNILVHFRAKTRVDDQGRRILFIEEIQSDWHQKGRKAGYQVSNAEVRQWEKEAKPLKQALNSLGQERDRFIAGSSDRVNQIHDAIKDMMSAGDVDWAGLLELFPHPGAPGVRGHRPGFRQLYGQKLRALPEIERSRLLQRIELENRVDAASEQYGALKHRIYSADSGVPDAPFKDTKAWTGLAVKRIMRMAADEGFDGVAFTSGRGATIASHLPKEGWAFYDEILPKVIQKHTGKPIGKTSFKFLRGRNPGELARLTDFNFVELTPELKKRVGGPQVLFQRPAAQQTGWEMKELGEGLVELASKEMRDGGGGLTFKVEGNVLRVQTTELPEALRGKGLGQEMYLRALRHAQEKGFGFASDIAPSPDALKTYERLIEQGIPLTRKTVEAADGKMVQQFVMTADDVAQADLVQFRRSLTAGEEDIDWAIAQVKKGRDVNAVKAQLAARLAYRSPKFKKWFGKSKAANEAGAPIEVYHGTGTKFDAFDIEQSGDFGNYLGKGAYFTTDLPTAEKWSTLRDPEWQRGYITRKADTPLDPDRNIVLKGYLRVENPFEWPPGSLGDDGSLAGLFRGKSGLPDEIADDVWAKLGMKPDSASPDSEIKQYRSYLNALDEAGQDVGRWEAEPRLYQAVQDVLKERGYDGVKRVNPKDGATEWVVFEPTQFKDRANIGTWDPEDARFLKQEVDETAKGAVEFLEDGRAIIYALEKPDFSTLVHEVGHILRRDLGPEDMGEVHKWVRQLGANVEVQAGRFIGDADEVRKAEEFFAEAFENYIKTGKAPSPGLKGAFERMKQWMVEIYKTVGPAATPSPAIVKIFDKMLAETAPTESAMPRVMKLIRRELLGPTKAPKLDVIKQMAREAHRMGVKNASYEELLKQLDETGSITLEGGIMADRFGTAGKAEFSTQDLVALTKDMEGELGAAAAKYRPNMALTAHAQAVQEMRPSDRIEQLMRGTKGDAKIRSLVKSTFMGGDVTKEKGLADLAPEMRGRVETAERGVKQGTAETIRLVAEAQTPEGYDRLLRYLTGENVGYLVGGRSVLTSGHNSVSSVMHNLKRFIDDKYTASGSLDDAIRLAEHLAAGGRLEKLGLASKIVKRAGTEMTEAQAIERAWKELFKSDATPKFLQDIMTAVSPKVAMGGTPTPKEFGDLLEIIMHYTGKSERGGNLFSGTPKELVGGMFDDITKVFGRDASMRVSVLMGTYGHADRARHLWPGLGLAIDKETMTLFRRWIMGEDVPSKHIPAVKKLVERFGMNPQFVEDALLDTTFYIPRAARDRLASALARGTDPKQINQMIKSEQEIKGLIGGVLRYMKLRMTRGGVVVRQRYFLMNTIDHFQQMAMINGLAPAIGSTIRVLAQDIMVLPGVARTIDVLQRGGVLKPRAAERLRKQLQHHGDKVARFFSGAKYSINVNPILEGAEGTFRVGGNVYAYKEIRDIAVQEGIFASFDTSELSNAVKRAGAALETDVTKQVTGAAAVKRQGREVAEYLTQVVTDTAEAWAERERLGGMVTLMELGIPPRQAAQLTIQSLFDYAGTMSKMDRAWFVSLALPFWAFQKNANRMVIDAMFSPWGAYRMGVIRRSQERGAELMTALMFDSVADDYGIDYGSLPPEVRDDYDNFRSMIEKHYGGHDKVPAEDKQAIRMWIHSRKINVEGGRHLELGALLHTYTEGDAPSFAAWGQPKPSKSGRPSYLRERSGITVPFRMTDATRKYYNAVFEKDDHPYTEIFIPDSTINAGFRHLSNMAAFYILAADEVGLDAGFLGDADDGSVSIDVMEPLRQVVDLERAPLIGDVMKAYTGKEGFPRRVHPWLAPIVDQGFNTEMLRVPAKSDTFESPAEEGSVEYEAERYYMFPGKWSIAFDNSPFGELNSMLLQQFQPTGEFPFVQPAMTPLEATSRRGRIVAWARAVSGVQTAETSGARTARREEPKRLTTTTRPK